MTAQGDFRDDLPAVTIAGYTSGSIYQAFAESALLHANHIALTTPDGDTSYRELASAASGIHTLLASCGVGRGTGVGVMFTQPERQIAAILGVLRAGAYYVFLDGTFPEQRLRQILADGAVKVLLAGAEYLTLAADLAQEKVPVVIAPENPSAAAPPTPATVDSQDLAYIAYTSGSTGIPKGVMHQHANVLHEAAVHRLTLGLNSDDRSTLLYSPGVTGSVRDLFGSLLAGGRLLPFPFKKLGVTELKRWLQAQGVTQFHSVPSIFRELMRAMEPDERLASVRTVFVAGERVSPKDFNLFRLHFPTTARFYTGIGATETSSIYTHWFVEESGSLRDGRLPTGWAVPQKQVLLVDEHRQPLAPGETGEIAVCSEYLSSGYWGQPSLTHAAFGPATDGSSRRIYYTGDYGYFDAEGRLVHLGRRDGQLKINGQRVEAGEIENALCEQPGIVAAAVRAFTDEANARPIIAAYVVAPDGLDESNLRDRLALRLQSAAMPTVIVRIEQLPLTANGKVDYPALARPSVTVCKAGARQEDWTVEERKILALWREVFPAALVYRRQDSFESLGGDSLQSVRLAELLFQRLGLDVSGGKFLRSASIETLALRLSAIKPSASWLDAEINRLDSLAVLWKLPDDCRRVADGCPVFLSGADQPGIPVLWFGQAGSGLEIGLELARRRPVYIIPSAAVPSAGQMETVCRHVAALVRPCLPDKVICGGCCYSGLQAMFLADELKNLGQEVDTLFLLDAFGSRWSRLVTLQFFRLQYHVGKLRSRGAAGVVRYLYGEVSRHWRSAKRRIATAPAEAAGAEPPYLIDFEPFGYDGRVFHILSSQTAWIARLMPRLGWTKTEASRTEIQTISGIHDDLWQHPTLLRVAAVLNEFAGRRDLPEPGKNGLANRNSQRTLENISDTARWVAVYRAWESCRPDAIFSDPLAGKLAGEEGERIVRKLGATWMASSIVVRTAAIDSFVEEAAANGVDTVLNLAAGLDTRPYRMNLPSSLHWIEVDLPGMVAYKESQLADEKPRCRLTRISQDLADVEGRRKLFKEAAAQSSRVLVITEGLLVYLPEPEVCTLAADLLAHENFVFWAQDFVAPPVLASLNKNWGGILRDADARMVFAPSGGADFYRPYGWKPRHVRHFSDDARRLKRDDHLRLAAHHAGETSYALLERA